EKETYARTTESATDVEFRALVGVIQAQSLSRNGKTEAAYKAMSEAIVLLDKLKGSKNTNVHRELAYKFMVDYYEKANRPTEALKYQKLLAESEAQRYENERVQAISDLSIKYETEKKEEEIARLAEQNQTAKEILILAFSLIAALLIALLIFILFFRLRKKSLEQSIYESALLAELKQDELEQIKQQLGQKPTKAMISKLSEWISKSVMEKTKKNAYIQQLSELDIDMLEHGYLAADEKITNMDMKYIICFAIDMDTKDMCLLFNVELPSIHTVRYRIKKKFSNKNTFKFLM
ncbi:MAG: hypothetical protein LBN11_02180, partial [Tannerella sp.]|nr:hypothetical protein [Tannerella sp.]